MFEHILLPLDFSGKHDPAIDLTRQMVAAGRSRLSLLHVIKSIEGVDDSEMREFYEILEDKAKMMLSRLQADLAKLSIAAETTIVFGKRAEEIVRFVEAAQVDLVVMSSRKLDTTAPVRPWPTVSHKVAVFAPCPVLLVR